MHIYIYSFGQSRADSRRFRAARSSRRDSCARSSRFAGFEENAKLTAAREYSHGSLRCHLRANPPPRVRLLLRAHKERKRSLPWPQKSSRGKRDLRTGAGKRECKSRRKMSWRCDTRYYPPKAPRKPYNDLTSPTFAVAPFRGAEKDKTRRDDLTVWIYIYIYIISDIIPLENAREDARDMCQGLTNTHWGIFKFRAIIPPII